MIRQPLIPVRLAGFGTGLPTVTGSRPPPRVKTVDLHHELGLYPEDQTLEHRLDINPYAPPSAILIRSHVTSKGAKGLSSPAYLATIRRRFAGKIGKLVEGLGGRAESENFPLWTHKVLESLQDSIQQLSAADELSSPEHEGNSCEILRQVRDTLLDCGWKKYREPQVRTAVVKILQRLVAADEVTAEDAFDSTDQLLELGLDPSVGMAWDDEQKEIPG